MNRYLLGGAVAGGQQDARSGVIHAHAKRDVEQLTHVAVAAACACPHPKSVADLNSRQTIAHVHLASGKTRPDACNGVLGVVVPESKPDAACSDQSKPKSAERGG
jgi:hypothetical protein